jgi:phenylalanyl-tRNA synthetase beta chain
MKFSEKWLREWVDPALSTQELAAQLTMAGLEVDAVTPVAGRVSGVVVGEIRAAEPHPDAERLSVCRVSDGVHEYQVVCGAPNARPGLRAPFAREGAVLPALTIARATLRGVESCGMLCSGDELGIDGESEGLLELPADAPLGRDVNEVLELDDHLIELGLTPNRGDCLGIVGLAREVAALNAMKLGGPTLRRVEPTIDETLDVTLAAPRACPRYVGRIIRGVDLAAESPLWLRERLRRSDVRSIDPIVDVTNYVMLELGQPLHAFDLQVVSEKIVVRMALPGERLVLLDGSELALREDTLVIADGGKAVALAGIMGGQNSAVGERTRDIFLESAFFAPAVMAGSARSYGMHTDASHRFERGVDFNIQVQAVERATELLLEIVGGEPGPVVEAVASEYLPELAPVALREERIDELLGITVPACEIEGILQRLGLHVRRDGAGWQAVPPSYRFDIRTESDLCEEVARVYGYERIPARVQNAAIPMRPRAEARLELGMLRRRLVDLGYQEAITYSFVEPRVQALLDPEREPVAVANPISADMAVMRTTLWSGLVKALQFNQNRQQRRVRLFETGLRFLPDPGGLQQRVAVAAIASGERWGENWASDNGPLDFFDIKGDLEALLEIGGGSDLLGFAEAAHPALHPGQCAALLRGGETVGYLGAMHPELLRAFDLHGPVYMFEFDYELASKKNLPNFNGLSKFPEVRRDIAVLVDVSVSAGRILQTARSAAGEWLTDLKLFDVYRGQGIDAKKKSMAIGVVLQHPERTLTDDEIAGIIQRMVSALARECGAALRD